MRLVIVRYMWLAGMGPTTQANAKDNEGVGRVSLAFRSARYALRTTRLSSVLRRIGSIVEAARSNIIGSPVSLNPRK
jgi:hypothetical protein